MNTGIPIHYPGGVPFLILVVDDEATMRRSLADILRLEGYRVQTAASGEEAIQRIQEEFYDLILLDLKMPGKSGIEVLRFITKNTPDTQVILLTAHGSLESSIEALRLGALDYLLKPASPETILSSVVKALTKRIEHLQYQELLTKLESSVQTHQGSKEAKHALHSQSVECILGSGVKVNFSQRVIWNDQNTISLTPTETRLLKTLSQNPGHVFTPQELVAIAQGYETTNQEAPGILRPLISRLRHKLSVFQDSQNWIVNVRGTGYCFYPGDNLPSL